MNIYAAYLAVQFPFVIYGFLYFKKIWKYVSGVVVCLVVFALFFASARTALLSMSIILLLFIGYLIYGVVKHKLPFKREVVILIILPIISAFVVLNVNRLDKSKMNSVNELLVSREADFYTGRNAVQNNTGNIKELMPTDVQVETTELRGSGRFSLWNLAYIRFKEHPILGIGYGNYKAIGKKEHYLIYSHREGLFASPRRTHNDFLEKMAETGIFGLLLYVALFVFPFVLFVKAFRREKQYEKQFVLVVILASAVAYTLDALLNFPLERPPVQLYFMLAVIFILLFSQKEAFVVQKPNNTKLNLLLFGGVFLISFAAMASNYLAFKSYQLELSIRNDFQGTSMFEKKANPKYDYESLKKQWTNYPDLTYVGTTKNVYLANYAIKDEKFDEAVAILKNSIGTNADGFIVKQTLANIYLKAYEDMDSVKHYASEVFESYPGFKTNFHALRSAYLKEKDTVNAFRVMNRYSKFAPRDAEEWKMKANIMYDLTKDSKRMLAIIDTALAYNANSNTLLLAKKEVLEKLKFKSHMSDEQVKAKHQVAYDYFKSQQYGEARKVFEGILKTNPKDYLSIQNIGIIDLIEKKYEAAIINLTKVIKAGVFPDGKAEYSRGYCFEQLDDFKRAKEDYKRSRAKKYPQAMTLPKSKYE
jgi:O-antigen ligase/Tfp pilus assembly protein PilF